MQLVYSMKAILLQDKELFNIFAYELKVRINQLLATNLAFGFLIFLTNPTFRTMKGKN